MRSSLLRFSIIALLLFSIQSFAQNEDTQLFKTSKKAEVVKNDSIDLDQYKDFIIIPEGRMFRKYFEKIGYFKEAIDYRTLVKWTKDPNKAKEDGALYTNEDYQKFYKNEKEFFTLFLTMAPDKMVDLSLVKFGTGAVFSVRDKAKTNLVGISAGTTTISAGTWDSMMNELVNYIRANSKTYKQ